MHLLEPPQQSFSRKSSPTISSLQLELEPVLDMLEYPMFDLHFYTGFLTIDTPLHCRLSVPYSFVADFVKTLQSLAIYLFSFPVVEQVVKICLK